MMMMMRHVRRVPTSIHLHSGTPLAIRSSSSSRTGEVMVARPRSHDAPRPRLRRFASVSTESHDEGEDKTRRELVEALVNVKKQTPDAAAAIAHALMPSVTSLSEGELHKLIEALPSDALASLEASGRRDIAEVKDAEVHVVVPKERTEFTIKGSEGETLRDLVRRGTELSRYLECVCGGNMACSTCHVYVNNDRGEKAADGTPLVESPSEEEQDMLDLAYEPREGVSRLGCQVKLRKGKRLEIELPEQWYNNFN